MNSLVSLSLVNFQKHRTFEHRFGQGLTVCFGPNWAGKSTLQRAILYALFGTSAVPVKGANLVTQGERHMEVRLAFLIDDARYEVARGTRGAVLSRQGSPGAGSSGAGGQMEPVASGHTAVTDSIEALIGPAKDFLHFQTVRQGEASSLLTLGSAKLSEHMNRATGVHLVDQVLEKVRDAQREVEGSLPALEAVNQVREQLRAETLSLLAETALAEDRALRAEERASELSVLLNSEARLLEARRTEYLESVKRQAEREALLRQLEALGPVAPAAPERISELEGQITQLQAAQAEAALNLRRKAELEANLKQAEQVLARGQPTVGRAELRASVADVEAAEAESIRCREALRQAEQELHSGACHACNRPFEGRDLTQLRDAMTAASEAFALASEAASSQRARHDQVLAEYRLGEHYASWLSYQQIAQAELAGLASVTEIPQAQIEALRGEKWALEQAIKTTERRAGLERQLQLLGDVSSVMPMYLDESEIKVAALREQLVEAQRQASAEQQALALLRQKAIAKEEQLQEADARAQVLEGQARRSQALMKLAKYLRGNRDRFAQHAWDQVLGFASDFVREATGGDVTALVRQGDEFLYEEGGELRPVELASGLQAAILGVAIKLALAAAVGSRFEVMLFDEVSAGAQDENSLRLTECLSRVAGQVFLISHREMDASVAAEVLSL